MLKILAIMAKDVRTTFTDGGLLLLMLATPLALATIIALAFSDITGDAPIQDIPVVIVNQDEGSNGQIFAASMIPDVEFDATAGGADSSDLDACEQRSSVR